MQVVVTYLLIIASVVYALYLGVCSFCRKKEEKASSCTNCTSCPARKEIFSLLEQKNRMQ